MHRFADGDGGAIYHWELANAGDTRSMVGQCPATARFEYSVVLNGSMTAEQRAEVQSVADACPVRRTL
jgi:hypothetical protein